MELMITRIMIKLHTLQCPVFYKFSLNRHWLRYSWLILPSYHIITYLFTKFAFNRKIIFVTLLHRKIHGVSRGLCLQPELYALNLNFPTTSDKDLEISCCLTDISDTLSTTPDTVLTVSVISELLDAVSCVDSVIF